MKRLDKPQQIADIYILGRIYKYVLIKSGKDESEKVDEKFEKDYFTFLAMFQ